MSRPVVIVFARAPRLGTVKRRLARDIGVREALRFHRNALSRLLRELRDLRGVDVVIAITPNRARDDLASRYRRIGQGRGDLGARMARAFRTFPRRRVVLIGSDIPGICAADIREGLRKLRGCDAVFGPAMDGGYWLIGMTGRRPAAPFGNVRWSSSHALDDTIANFAGHRIRYLRHLRDIDDAAAFYSTVTDFARLRG
ncbi:TIGR04282 family arsenosugar biosynthesis glycosyltransferase [Acidiphilium sp. AL]|uniref:TIGR04282 family arsenosugar biosynthesis glycosyltransferase n=1 Tax=Acidiphilium sp. AL TaxID=2871704 RepID=UPI0021CB6F15|nr:TIGR04282 family arsenosugar biosynthesis glycosyltransferase [Acidiphilium sp. AL]MCU4158705.1 TIGR04282 family arsenosugar biosynthesis glycosyltransferase [Acidiphilium sp. AL]